MSLTALRTREEDLRRQLERVRAALESAVAAANAGARAEQELATMRERETRAQGAYRGAATEHEAALHAEIEAGKPAREKRERLRREESTLLDELEKTRLDIERAGVRRTLLPMLDGIPNARPCKMRWSDMRGDGDVRVCPRCRANAWNVAMLDPAAAESLLGVALGARFHRREDGTILARDCAGSDRKVPWIPLVALFLVLAVGGAIFFAVNVERVPRHGDYFYTGETTKRPHPIPTPTHNVTGPIPIDGPPTSFGDTIGDASAPIVLPTLGSPVTLDISAGRGGLGGADSFEAKLLRANAGDRFLYSLECRTVHYRGNVTAWGLHRSGSMPVSLPAAFVAELARTKVSTAPPERCGHTDDFPHVNVSLGTDSSTVNLTVNNCSFQWLENGTLLEPRPEITKAYEAILAAMHVTECYSDATKAPPIQPTFTHRIVDVGPR